MSPFLEINAFRGAQFFRLITIKDENGVAVDLTGSTFHGRAADDLKLPKKIIPFQITVKDQTTNPGEIEWLIEEASTSNIPVSESSLYSFTIWKTTGSETIVLINGKLNLKGTVQ